MSTIGLHTASNKRMGDFRFDAVNFINDINVYRAEASRSRFLARRKKMARGKLQRKTGNKIRRGKEGGKPRQRKKSRKKTRRKNTQKRDGKEAKSSQDYKIIFRLF